MSYQDIVAANTRLAILQLLYKDPGYDHNEHILLNLLEECKQIQVSSDALQTHLAWLEEQGLVTLSTMAEITRVAKLTTRGADVATGRTVVPGVRRPRPEEL